MILRRITEHVKAQNWTAVGLDFAIVVVGVFIGIQVSNWNAARGERDLEAQYLARLQQELSDMAPRAQSLSENAWSRYDLIDQVRAYLETGDNRSALNGTHCAAIGRSHIYAGVIFNPPTIRELISTGRITLIRDETIRTAILAFDQTKDDISQLRTDIQIDRLPLARKYPDIVEQSLTDWEDSICDFDAMVGNRPFLNDFNDNRRRFGAYVDDVLGQQSTLITSLGEKVAESRGSVFTPAPMEPTSEAAVPEEAG